MKRLFLIGFMLLISQMSIGQNFNGIWDRLSFGVKAGGNYSDFVKTNFATEGLAGYHGGLIVNFRLTDKWSIQEEFLYSTQGAKAKNTSIFQSKKDLELSYLSVPIIIKYHSDLGLYAELGAQSNVLVEDVKNTGLGNFAKKLDVGGILGIGYQFKAGPIKGMGVGARYYYGFTNVGKFKSSVTKSNFRNSVAQASIFYMF